MPRPVSNRLNRELEAAVGAQDFELAAELRDRERKLRNKHRAQQQEMKDNRAEEEVYVTEEDIAESWRCGPASR